jgi:hypothetical protein
MEGREAIQASNVCTKGCASEASEESAADSEKGSSTDMSEMDAGAIFATISLVGAAVSVAGAIVAYMMVRR